MALDGIAIANIASEMRRRLVGGRITKIAQPENDELMLTIKNQKDTAKLLISAGASLPLIYFTETQKPNPATAPNFCMLLRKHIGGGRITAVTQPGLERIIRIQVEHLDEMGDLCHRNLIVELMGKYSNIIFTDQNDVIIDSIKRIPLTVSSVREVLPGRDYFIPDTVHKLDPLTVTEEDFETVFNCIKRRIAEMGDGIRSGKIDVAPIGISGYDGCKYCDFAAVCDMTDDKKREGRISSRAGISNVLDAMREEETDNGTAI